MRSATMALLLTAVVSSVQAQTTPADTGLADQVVKRDRFVEKVTIKEVRRFRETHLR